MKKCNLVIEDSSFEAHLKALRSCQNCIATLPLGPNPIVQLSPRAQILIISQAPGTRAHETSTTFNDPSGDRLREWLKMDRQQFYNPEEIAIMPMGFCYPGRNPKGGDLPPASVCAPLWHQKTLNYLPNIQLILLVGQYAQKHYLGDRRKKTLTQTVKAWQEFLPTYFPLPHPSWRNIGWCAANEWFEKEVLPELQDKVWSILKP
ncbi:uracil-DNA glycosylase family protein [Candidatus Paracaedibacter symbiosus]|uniref:uracil-DNA glycosylase family protein n=1 Tax=Candidatus Paracaedibacter symbiosus TaxID=244582 RepID=UPI000509E1EC|nr:uracil-DNA glycosylase family protein [Candidatus Paracaedibacter symbiosus]